MHAQLVNPEDSKEQREDEPAQTTVCHNRKKMKKDDQGYEARKQDREMMAISAIILWEKCQADFDEMDEELMWMWREIKTQNSGTKNWGIYLTWRFGNLEWRSEKRGFQDVPWIQTVRTPGLEPDKLELFLEQLADGPSTVHE